MTHLIVTTNKQTSDVFDDVLDYATENGELDVVDPSGVVVATFAAGSWVSVRRYKEGNEKWPDSLYSPKADVPKKDSGEINFDGIEAGSEFAAMIRDGQLEFPHE